MHNLVYAVTGVGEHMSTHRPVCFALLWPRQLGGAAEWKSASSPSNPIRRLRSWGVWSSPPPSLSLSLKRLPTTFSYHTSLCHCFVSAGRRRDHRGTKNARSTASNLSAELERFGGSLNKAGSSRFARRFRRRITAEKKIIWNFWCATELGNNNRAFPTFESRRLI